MYKCVLFSLLYCILVVFVGLAQFAFLFLYF